MSMFIYDVAIGSNYETYKMLFVYDFLDSKLSDFTTLAQHLQRFYF